MYRIDRRIARSILTRRCLLPGFALFVNDAVEKCLASTAGTGLIGLIRGLPAACRCFRFSYPTSKSDKNHQNSVTSITGPDPLSFQRVDSRHANIAITLVSCQFVRCRDIAADASRRKRRTDGNTRPHSGYGRSQRFPRDWSGRSEQCRDSGARRSTPTQSSGHHGCVRLASRNASPA